MSTPILNKVRERILFLSPTVQAGWEPESKITDFEEQKLLGQGTSWCMIRDRCLWSRQEGGPQKDQHRIRHQDRAEDHVEVDQHGGVDDQWGQDHVLPQPPLHSETLQSFWGWLEPLLDSRVRTHRITSSKNNRVNCMLLCGSNLQNALTRKFQLK